MKTLLTRLETAGRLAENVALVALLGSMVVLAVLQIALRQFFDGSLVWADEFIKITVLWLAMVGSIAAARDNRHIRIDVLSHILPDKAATAARAIVDVFAAAVSAVIAWQAWRYLQLEIEFGETVLVNKPAWIAHGVVPLAFLIVSYRFIVSAIAEVAGARRDGWQESDES